MYQIKKSDMKKESTMKIMNCFWTKATVHSLSSVNRLVKAGKSFRRKSTRVRCVFALLICVLLLGMPAVAQTTSANLSGTVTDPTGAFLPGATVVAASTDQNVRSTNLRQKGILQHQ